MTNPAQSKQTVHHESRSVNRAAKVTPMNVGVLTTIGFAALSSLIPATAQAADGCTVMLCLAAPNWRAVPQCVPPIRQLFHDLARGRSFPSCPMRGTGNSASNEWAQAPSLCPPQYTHLIDIERGPIYRCDYTGAVSVSINGAMFARTWWNTDGNAVTEFSPAAKTQLGTWNTQFDTDYAAWLAMQAAPLPGEQP